jgi:chromosome segregation ATPase
MYELQASSTKIEENQKQLQQKEDELKSQADEIKRLKILNAELMSSYNEANSKMEEMKKVGTHSESVNNLSANICKCKSV